MYDDRTNLAQQVTDTLREYFKERLFRTVIPRNVRLAEAPSHGKPVPFTMRVPAAQRPTSSWLGSTWRATASRFRVKKSVLPPSKRRRSAFYQVPDGCIKPPPHTSLTP